MYVRHFVKVTTPRRGLCRGYIGSGAMAAGGNDLLETGMPMRLTWL